MTGIPNVRDLAVKDRFLFFFFLLTGKIYVNSDEHVWTLNSLTFKASKIKASQLRRNGNKQQIRSLGLLWLHTHGIVWLRPAPPRWQRLLWTDRQTDSSQTLLLCPSLQPESPGGFFQDYPGITAAGERTRLGRQTVIISALQWIPEKSHFAPFCTFPPSSSLPKWGYNTVLIIE